MEGVGPRRPDGTPGAMFNIGPLELMVILLLALVVVGPSRLPEVGRSIGRGLRELRKVQDEVRDSINFDLDADPAPPKPAPRPRTPRSTATGRAAAPATPIEPDIEPDDDVPAAGPSDDPIGRRGAGAGAGPAPTVEPPPASPNGATPGEPPQE